MSVTCAKPSKTVMVRLRQSGSSQVDRQKSNECSLLATKMGNSLGFQLLGEKHSVSQGLKAIKRLIPRSGTIQLGHSRMITKSCSFKSMRRTKKVSLKSLMQAGAEPNLNLWYATKQKTINQRRRTYSLKRSLNNYQSLNEKISSAHPMMQ